MGVTGKTRKSKRSAARRNSERELKIAVGVFVGVVLPFAGAAAPPGWLLCDGSLVGETEFPDLFKVLGTTYGSGSGTFAVPDMRNRTPVGVASAGIVTALGATNGAQQALLTTSELPAHTHSTPSHTHSMQNHTHAKGTLSVVPNKAKNFVYEDTSNGTLKALDPGSDYELNTDADVGGSTAGPSTPSTGSSAGTTGNAGSGSAFSIVQPCIGLNFIIRAV